MRPCWLEVLTNERAPGAGRPRRAGRRSYAHGTVARVPDRRDGRRRIDPLDGRRRRFRSADSIQGHDYWFGGQAMKVYAPSPEELAAALDVCFWCRKVLDSVIRGQPVEPEHFINLCADLR